MASPSTLAAPGSKKTTVHNKGSLEAPEAKKMKMDNEIYSSKLEAEESVGESEYENDSIASASSTKKMLILRSSDNKTFEIEESVTLASITLRETIELVGVDNMIPLANVSSKILALVISYLNKHHNVEEIREMLKWDKEIFKAIDDIQMIVDLINASNYLNIKSLQDSACDEAAERVKDTTVEEGRALFGCENDFTPEEEAEMRQEYAHAFQI
ncbi:SKP1-like protein 14 [Papaver somniferum]|uniref:SKP1-like protein 14 n=1 Tax=Papaver somniferum TaxID=3469 RepID=UPI000E6F8101|nr:SKP1-like protein 14 [Papaver somniferum]